jgi:hypothetical protein
MGFSVSVENILITLSQLSRLQSNHNKIWLWKKVSKGRTSIINSLIILHSAITDGYIKRFPWFKAAMGNVARNKKEF